MSLLYSFIWLGFWSAQILQIYMLTLPQIWKVASSVNSTFPMKVLLAIHSSNSYQIALQTVSFSGSRRCIGLTYYGRVFNLYCTLPHTVVWATSNSLNSLLVDVFELRFMAFSMAYTLSGSVGGVKKCFSSAIFPIPRNLSKTFLISCPPAKAWHFEFSYKIFSDLFIGYSSQRVIWNSRSFFYYKHFLISLENKRMIINNKCMGIHYYYHYVISCNTHFEENPFLHDSIKRLLKHYKTITSLKHFTVSHKPDHLTWIR